MSHRNCAKLDPNHSVADSSFESVMTGTGGGFSIGPSTPVFNRESVDYHLADSPSPILLPYKQLLYFDSQWTDGCADSLNEDSPRTPREGVFDPFAPGPEKLILAPRRRKYAGESRVIVARRLDYDSFTKFTDTNHDTTVYEEEMLFKTVYLSLLEAIISTQITEIEKVPSLLLVSDGCQTPHIAPRHSGVSNSCPGAPLKGTNNLKTIDKEICRKLEF